MASYKTKWKLRRRCSMSRNSKNGRGKPVAWRIGPIKMHFVPSVCTRAISLCLLLVSSLLFPAAGVQREPSSTTTFMDVTRSAGIDFRLTCGGAKKLYIMESMCVGGALFDYDNRGWADV